VLLTIILVILNGFFAMSEMALVNAKHTALQMTVEEGQAQDASAAKHRRAAKAKQTMELASKPDRFLATVQVGTTLVGFGASAVAASTFAEPIEQWVDGFGIGWLTAISGPLALVVTTLIISYVTLVVGELTPKRIALSNPEGTAMRVTGVISGIQRVLHPVVAFLSLSTNAVSKVFGIKKPQPTEEVSEDELKFMVSEQPDLLDEEKRMIHEIFDLGDTVAREIMTPRVDMICIEDDSTVKQTMERMRGTGFSRMPVFHDTPDKVIGVAMLKDLLVPMVDERADDCITDYMRDVAFVPETKDILPLLGEMQTSHQQLAVVVDEYGGTAGLITIEDIVEEIVGEISDEYDPDNKYQTQLSEDEWLIDGRLPVEDAEELGLPVEEGDDYDTIAGWLLDRIDTMPEVGDSFDFDGYRFKIQTMRRKRISMLRVSRLEAPPLPDTDTTSPTLDASNGERD
jgi:putative hemolysin